eukprot:m.225507 g.225507  ORF g.225507 m.225507 type:complete len:115 (-) comp11273_c0_seq1:102-446(-)
MSTEDLRKEEAALDADEKQDKKGKGKGKRARQEEAGLDEKRLKFLERNRAAATRCREKKKHWMQELQQKANTLSVANTQMQNELAQLRDEIAQMKAILGGEKPFPHPQFAGAPF